MSTKMKKLTPDFIIKLFMILTLMLFFGFGCGGSGGGNSTESEDITATSSENERLEAALSATINVLDKGQKEQDMSKLNDKIPLIPKMGKRTSQASFDSCYTMSNFSQTGATLTFNGSAECGGMSGSVSYKASNNGQGLILSYKNVDMTGDGCKINGDILVNFSQSGEYSNITTTYDHLDICGETLRGAIYGSYNDSTGEYVVTMDDESVTVSTVRGTISGRFETDITFDDDGYAGGTTEVIIGDQIYTCLINDVFMDTGCSVPTSGTIQISNGSDTILVDFSSTDCENITVTYTYNGETFTYNLDVEVELES